VGGDAYRSLSWLESLSVARGESFDSPEFMLLGDEWSLAVYPGGDETAEEGLVSLDLYNMSDKAIEVDVCFGVIDGNGKQVAYKRGPFIFDPEEGDDSVGMGFRRFCQALRPIELSHQRSLGH
jgi:hypothetical protein